MNICDIKLNLNCTVKVKLSKRGSEVNSQLDSPLHEDGDGYISSQLWMIMSIFGKYTGYKKESLFENNSIILINPDKFSEVIE